MIPAAMFSIQRATLAAQRRLHDASVGVRVLKGRAQIVRVMPLPSGDCDVQAITQWMPVASVAVALDRLQAGA